MFVPRDMSIFGDLDECCSAGVFAGEILQEGADQPKLGNVLAFQQLFSPGVKR